MNREKVIKGLECHAEVNCVECPYRDGWRTCNFGETLLADTLSLLKEQEVQRDYEASVEMAEYCERYEQTYNPEDGSM